MVLQRKTENWNVFHFRLLVRKSSDRSNNFYKKQKNFILDPFWALFVNFMANTIFFCEIQKKQMNKFYEKFVTDVKID